MTNIHEILKSIGLEVPEDKKAEFDKAVIENYKTVAEVENIKSKLSKATQELDETKETLNTTNKAFEDLKNSNASEEDWETKYNDLVKENRVKEENRAKEAQEAQARAEFDKYFSENGKEWNNPFIADGYYNKFKEVKDLDENKGKLTADILFELTKDDATAFKTTTPIVTLKGSAGGLGGNADTTPLPTIF